MEQMISVEQIISLVPEEDRLWCGIGIAVVAVLFTATGLIQWHRIRRLRSECKEYPSIQRNLMWIDWPCPIAFLTLLVLLGMAKGVSWWLQTVMAMAGFGAGCFLAVVAIRPPKPKQAAGVKRSKCSNQEAREKRGATLVFPSSSRPAVEATDGPEGQANGAAVPPCQVNCGRSAAESATDVAWRD